MSAKSKPTSAPHPPSSGTKQQGKKEKAAARKGYVAPATDNAFGAGGASSFNSSNPFGTNAPFASTKTPSVASGATTSRSARRAAMNVQQANRNLEDIYHNPILPPALMTKARDMFDQYLALQQRTIQTRDSVLTGGGAGENDDDQVVEELSASTTQQVLTDLGVAMTENETKDLIFALRQSSDMQHFNQKVLDKANGVGEEEDEEQQLAPTIIAPPEESGESESQQPSNAHQSRGSRHRGSSVARKQSTTSNQQQQVMNATSRSLGGRSQQTTSQQQQQPAKTASTENTNLPFHLFVDLLAMTLPDVSYDKEMAGLWRSLDADQDDALGHKDIASAYQRIATGGSEKDELPTREQIEALLKELDCDDDNIVSYQDFLASMNTN